MTAILAITRAGPLASVQDAGRFGHLAHGISASGPMDAAAFRLAGALVGADHAGLEITMAGLALRLEGGTCRLGLAGGAFVARLNGQVVDWPGQVTLQQGDELAITPGAWGNYGYLRFDRALLLPPLMGSLATSSRARLGGLDGRALQVGDVLELRGSASAAAPAIVPPEQAEPDGGPIRFIWGLHADLFSPAVRQGFCEARFTISSRLDRMGVRLADTADLFADTGQLGLVSDAIVPGDIQILGDGTPTVLMRDHQPTGGYPRIGTVITPDLDRLAQLRPGSALGFTPVSLAHAHAILKRRRP